MSIRDFLLCIWYYLIKIHNLQKSGFILILSFKNKILITIFGILKRLLLLIYLSFLYHFSFIASLLIWYILFIVWYGLFQAKSLVY